MPEQQKKIRGSLIVRKQLLGGKAEMWMLLKIQVLVQHQMRSNGCGPRISTPYVKNKMAEALFLPKERYLSRPE